MPLTRPRSWGLQLTASNQNSQSGVTFSLLGRERLEGNTVLQAHKPSAGEWGRAKRLLLSVSSSLRWPGPLRTAWGETPKWVGLSCCSLPAPARAGVPRVPILSLELSFQAPPLFPTSPYYPGQQAFS